MVGLWGVSGFRFRVGGLGWEEGVDSLALWRVGWGLSVGEVVGFSNAGMVLFSFLVTWREGFGMGRRHIIRLVLVAGDSKIGERWEGWMNKVTFQGKPRENRLIFGRWSGASYPGTESRLVCCLRVWKWNAWLQIMCAP